VNLHGAQREPSAMPLLDGWYDADGELGPSSLATVITTVRFGRRET
jgi:hypothetical protein